jgi:hypothetical protein
LLDEIVLERQRFFVVGDDDVVDIDRLAYERAGFRVLPAAFVEVAGDAAAQVLCLAHVDDFAFGVLIEINAGLGGDGADFGEEIHFWEDEFILFDGCARPVLLRKCAPSLEPYRIKFP